MKPEHIAAMQVICKTQEELQAVWDNPAVYKFGNKLQAWVTMCVVDDGPDYRKQLKWMAAVRLANPLKRNFKSVALWTAHERIKARNILLDLLGDVGVAVGDEEFQTTKAMHYNKKLTAEEWGIVLKPHLLGN